MKLFTTATVNYAHAVSPVDDHVTLQWTGTSSGELMATVPFAWTFAITPVGSAVSNVNWQLVYKHTVDGVLTTLYDSGTQTDLTPNGETLLDTSTAVGKPISNWVVTLTVNYHSDFNYSGVSVDVPSSSIDLGSAAIPEPGTWMLMSSGLGLVALALRRRR